jgi:aryl-alcohol dehydrogenase-like predicted oxidoreductase
MQRRPLGKTGLCVSPIGFGSFKIGRNQKAKYRAQYALPDEGAVGQLLNAVLDMGINYIDTAPAYGLSEERIGKALAHRRREFVLSTKAGETFENGRSTYDFSGAAIRASVERSLQRLRTDVLDVVFLHSDGRDLEILNGSDAVETLQTLRRDGCVRTIGFSGKTVEGARQAASWADVVMVEYHLQDMSHAAVISAARRQGVGVVVKKGLASGHLPAAEAIRFVLSNPDVDTLIVGGLDVEHVRANVAAVADGEPVSTRRGA